MQIMAPFTPFISEHMYQSLRRALPSACTLHHPLHHQMLL